jgi:hypothetical protein
LLHRVELHKSTSRELVNSEAIKKNSWLFHRSVSNAGSIRAIVLAPHRSLE